jgi:excinuclease ABC subunit C
MLPRPDLEPKLKSLPAKPGVYQYFNAAGEIIYIGKANNLRSRVRSYFHASSNYDPKTHRLVANIADIEWIVTGSELEALLLEMNLIKEHRPHYNILLKDDKRYPFIKVTWQEDFPKVESTRRILKDGARYFGPYTSSGAMRETLGTLRKVFPFLDCNRVIDGQDERACLYYDIGLCLGPCIGAVDRAGYRSMIDKLCHFLEGDTAEVLAGIETRMLEHAERMEFEQAARMRDRMDAIRQVVERQRIIAPTLSDQDVVAVAREDGAALAQVFFVRNGKLIGREYFQLDGAEDASESTLLTEFIKQFYDESGKVPGEIVVPEHLVESEIIERWLAEKRGTRVRIKVPQRGRKRDLVEVAISNAAETLRALQMAHTVETRDDVASEAVSGLQAALDLPRPPARIECYDISTLQGTHTVGSMVVFQDAVPAKADYRHFRIKTVQGQDDFASMAEVLKRRFGRLARYRAAGELSPEEGASEPGASEPSAFERTPDLILVDGGKGQLGYALKVLQQLGLDDIPLASLAKREEELFLPGQKTAVRLPRDSQALYMVQRARDEAHRFAIGYNRKLRRNAGLRSSLDTVPGIGPKRRKALLAQFGSVDGIRNASIDELAGVSGMTRRAAEQLKAYL